VTDYFGSLVSRVLQPELGVQPRRRVPFEAAVPARLDSPNREAEPVSSPGERRAAPADADRAVASQDRRRGRPERSGELAIDASPAGGRAPRARRPIDEPGVGDTAGVTVGPHPAIRDVGSAPFAAKRDPRTSQSTPDRPQPARIANAAAPAPIVPARVHSVRGAATAHRDTPDSDSVIRIHIGRVDVRAVTSAPAAHQPKPRDGNRGLMTLEEYVQKRGGRS
jgi:hypothetical protein